MKQPRILLFCHDTTGLGHLRRISRIAGYLQGSFACLIATGMEQACWMTPRGCEFIKLPSWDSISAARAARRNQPLWMRTTAEEACTLKSDLLRAVSIAYRPDVVLVDYLPFGL